MRGRTCPYRSIPAGATGQQHPSPERTDRGLDCSVEHCRSARRREADRPHATRATRGCRPADRQRATWATRGGRHLVGVGLAGGASDDSSGARAADLITGRAVAGVRRVRLRRGRVRGACRDSVQPYGSVFVEVADRRVHLGESERAEPLTAIGAQPVAVALARTEDVAVAWGTDARRRAAERLCECAQVRHGRACWHVSRINAGRESSSRSGTRPARTNSESTRNNWGWSVVCG